MACIAAAEIMNTVDLARFCLSAGCVLSPEDLRHTEDPHYIQPDDCAVISKVLTSMLAAKLVHKRCTLVAGAAKRRSVYWGQLPQVCSM